MMENNNSNSGFNPLEWLAPQPAPTGATANTGTATAKATKAHRQPLTHAGELALAKAVARELMSRGGNIAETYDDYVRLGFSLANGLGSDGRNLYHTLCARSTKDRMDDCERKWQECLRKADGRTTIATFYHMAQQAGVDISRVAREVSFRNRF